MCVEFSIMFIVTKINGEQTTQEILKKFLTAKAFFIISSKLLYNSKVMPIITFYASKCT